MMTNCESQLYVLFTDSKYFICLAMTMYYSIVWDTKSLLLRLDWKKMHF